MWGNPVVFQCHYDCVYCVSWLLLNVTLFKMRCQYIGMLTVRNVELLYYTLLFESMQYHI